MWNFACRMNWVSNPRIPEFYIQLTSSEIVDVECNYIQSTPSLSKSKGSVFSFEITEFCHKGSNICAIQALEERLTSL